MKERAFALRQQGWRATDRIASGWLDLEYVGAEIGGDLRGK